MYTIQHEVTTINTLSEVQKEGVNHINGPCMVISGAGSGKTKVITNRIAYLLEQKINPSSILCLTFTNKAAKEMHNRISNLIDLKQTKGLWIGTFHSIFARILRSEASNIGYSNNFIIYDTDDSLSLIKSIIKELHLDITIYKPNLVLSIISKIKNQYSASEDALSTYSKNFKMLPEIFNRYKNKCLNSNAMDFDDILINTYRLLINNKEVLDKYSTKFEYVMVDEFQDTNFIQYAIIKTIANKHRNIFIVGDDAQSIYKFRGADINNILSFKQDYPETKIIKLEQNYRSTQNIVNAANSVINKNKQQLRKEIWTNNEVGEKIFLTEFINDIEESLFVSTSITNQVNNVDINYSNFVVLYRTNSQSRILEETFRRKGIPYKIIGGLSFYQRKEIKDFIAYLRLISNNKDDEALKRIINIPKRGIGEGTMDKIQTIANEESKSIWEVINSSYLDQLKPNIRSSITKFISIINDTTEYAKTNNAYDVAYKIASQSGILASLYEDKTIEGLSRYENIQEILNSINTFVQSNSDSSLSVFLQEISLLTNADDKQNVEENNKVTLMTVHSAKGLEFDYVYIVGLEEDLFPSFMMNKNIADLEEERRLFYVAMTRAKKRLFLSYTLNRNKFGKIFECNPSRFIDEIDKKFIFFSNSPNINFFSKRITKVDQNQVIKPLPLEYADIHEGLKVKHSKFGIGIITKISNIEGSNRVQVNFNNYGEKTLLLDFAKLEIIDNDK